MSYKVKLHPSGVLFDADADSTLLESANKSGVPIKHSCKKGDCKECVAELRSGEIRNAEGKVQSSGSFYTCCSSPLCDVEIGIEYYPELKGIANKTLPVKVSSIETMADDVLKIVFRTPPSSKLMYVPGQYINLSYNGIVRPYSIANYKSPLGDIELHVKRIKNGQMSTELFDDLEPNTLMRLNGPNGTFFVRESKAPIVFLATGTGFAPVKAMVEGLLHERSDREICFFWGGRSEASLYSNIPCMWEELYPNFKYFPVLSRPERRWDGEIGYVQSVFLKRFNNVSDFHVYACGSPNMIRDAGELLIGKGLHDSNFYSDAFTAAK